MGCFDSVIVKCPSCKKEVEFQSKSGDCTLSRYTLEEAPEDVLKDVNRHSPVSCLGCDAKLVVVVSTFRDRQVYAIDPKKRACASEDAHVFDSTGQCIPCGAHRRPA